MPVLSDSKGLTIRLSPKEYLNFFYKLWPFDRFRIIQQSIQLICSFLSCCILLLFVYEFHLFRGEDFIYLSDIGQVLLGFRLVLFSFSYFAKIYKFVKFYC